MKDLPSQKIVTVKLGGSTMDDENVVCQLAEDVVSLQGPSLRFVIVHGGGKEITRRMELAGVKPKKIQGLRITDDAVMKIVEQAMIDINKQVCDIFKRNGATPDSIIGADGLLLCKKKPPVVIKEKGSERKIDLGRVGSVSRVESRMIFDSIKSGRIPIIAPFGKDSTGRTLNVNADTAAGSIAGACSEKFILLTDVDGIYVPTKVGKTLLKTLKISDIHDLEKKGIINEGMLPKTQACIHALQSGVKSARIANGMRDHPLHSIFSETPQGTEITR